MALSIGRMILAGGAMAAMAVPASAQDRWDWGGGRAGEAAIPLAGPGMRVLLPELGDSRRGRAFVARNFDLDHDRWITIREARAANTTFLEIAGADRARFDWEGHDRGYDRAAPPPRGEWDRGAMRDYHFRQTAEGAMMSMQEDVLFRTDSAELRPGAIEKLRPLAAYLRDNPGVRVAIIGHTDSRGSDAHNQDLSERRAESVRMAFDDLGVTRARFRVAGRGEFQPVASNATAAGQRLNRRVEVTLLGQRADSFGG